jgi:hypothetical protein
MLAQFRSGIAAGRPRKKKEKKRRRRVTDKRGLSPIPLFESINDALRDGYRAHKACVK